MGITVDILSDTRYRIDRKRIRSVVEKTMTTHGVLGDSEVVVSVVGARKMKDLHKKYMTTAEVTGVLSFPQEDSGSAPFMKFPDGILRMGDIVVCYPVAVQQAAAGNKMVDDEIDFLVEHGCLHLLGIHHEE